MGVVVNAITDAGTGLGTKGPFGGLGGEAGLKLADPLSK